jgi:hypothetical protein
MSKKKYKQTTQLPYQKITEFKIQRPKRKSNIDINVAVALEGIFEGEEGNRKCC